MAANLSNARANTILDALPTMYAFLSSTLPNADGTNITEPAQGDYVRPSVSFAAAANRVRVSNAIADFISGGGNASGSAGNFSYGGLMTAASGGTLIWFGTLVVPVAWVVGQPVEIAAGDITIGFPSA